MYIDRKEASAVLSRKLSAYSNSKGIVLPVSRSGVIPGYELSNVLSMPMELILSVSVSHPFLPGHNIGLVTVHGALIHNFSGISPDYIKQELKQAEIILRNRSLIFMSGNEPADLKNKIVILTDDGFEGVKVMPAIAKIIRKSGPSKIIAALPFVTAFVSEALEKTADEIIFLEKNNEAAEASKFYEDYPMVSDDEVIHLIRNADRYKRDLHKA